jgi:hypothetical protein
MMSKKSRYRVMAECTISVETIVEASSPEKARDLAHERTMMSLCHSCSSGSPEEEWVTTGELDGEPMNLKVEEDADEG